jgi:ribosomal protein S18 acetylase RimI-like enzyme
LAAWGWDAAQAAAFLQMQYRAQQHHYATHFAQATPQIICYDGLPIGRLIVASTDEEVRLVDIAILPAYRSAGIGTILLGNILTAAAQTGRPVRLHVEAHNRARRLYERLGFTVVTATGPYYLLEKLPPIVSPI